MPQHIIPASAAEADWTRALRYAYESAATAQDGTAANDTFGNYVVISWWGDIAIAAFTNVGNPYTVPSGKTYSPIAALIAYTLEDDPSGRDMKLRNITDSVDVVANTIMDNANGIFWFGDAGTPSLPTVAAGKQIQLQASSAGGTNRSMGAAVIGVLK